MTMTWGPIKSVIYIPVGDLRQGVSFFENSLYKNGNILEKKLLK